MSVRSSPNQFRSQPPPICSKDTEHRDDNKRKRERKKRTSAVWFDAISACLPPFLPAPGTPRYLMRRQEKKENKGN
jgi:hypothetical protein